MAADTSLPATSCYLDEEAFRRSCELFLEHSHSLGDGWAWEKFCGSETEGFMHKTVMVPYRVSSLPCQRTLDTDALMEEEQLSDQDEAARELTAEAEGQAAVRYEYHVVYSCSYQIPILYFRASTLEGRSLSLEEVWNNVHPNYQQRLRQGPWDTITQQEHPLLGQPFFMLHPCKTEEFMRPALETGRAEKKGVNYIVTWLSVVGPVVGLDVPLSYGLAVPPAPETAGTTVTTASASASASAVAEASSSTSASTSICAAEQTD